MGETRHLARYTPQAKTLVSRIIRRFQAAIIKTKAFTRTILQKKLAIVATGQRLARQSCSAIWIEQAILIQQAARIREMRRYIDHVTDIGALGGLASLNIAGTMQFRICRTTN